MIETKVHLSPAEMELMRSAEIILTKNIVLNKITQVLQNIQNKQTEYIITNNKTAEKEIFSPAPKISKGQNYLGLPYLVLDFPRNFSNPDICAIRTMFWWGNFFSTTLHLSGDFVLHEKNTINHNFNKLKEEKYYLGIHENPWLHHFEKDNFQKISSMSKEQFENYCKTLKHIKIAKKYSFTDMDIISAKIFESWKFLVSMLVA